MRNENKKGFKRTGEPSTAAISLLARSLYPTFFGYEILLWHPESTDCIPVSGYSQHLSDIIINAI